MIEEERKFKGKGLSLTKIKFKMSAEAEYIGWSGTFLLDVLRHGKKGCQGEEE